MNSFDTNSSDTQTRDSRSRELFGEAQTLMPGGVNSPVRAFGAVGGTPRFMARGQGPFLFDEDGNRLIDYVCSWGPLIHGHAPAFVHDAVKAQLDNGASYGAPTALEVEMARAVLAAVPSMEMVRMVNSGTEAVMGALRAARGWGMKKNPDRFKIIKFAGCYHGHADALVGAGRQRRDDFGRARFGGRDAARHRRYRDSEVQRFRGHAPFNPRVGRPFGVRCHRADARQYGFSSRAPRLFGDAARGNPTRRRTFVV